MSLPVFQRVLSMDAEEILFRATTAVRTQLHRSAAVVGPPRWRRGRLRRRLHLSHRAPRLAAVHEALRRKDWFAAHEGLGRHFMERRGGTPADASGLDAAATAIHARFPTAESDAREQAASILRGHYDVLGYVNVPFGHDPDWHLDPVSGCRAPRDFWADVPYLEPRCGDHKIIWELNRHQHWLHLGRAFKLTGDRAYYDRFTAELESWLSANPPLTGTNWASMLELAFRSLSWIWAMQFFASSATTSDRYPWLVDLLIAVDSQLQHVSQNLSRYFSPNTHLTGEALALYVAGQSLPELRGASRWARLGREVLLEESRTQIAGDGGHLELSAHYHRYSTDFYLLALLVARRSGDSAAAEFERAARAQAEYLRVICDDNGFRPYTGDDDGGQLFPICGRPSEDCEDTLSNAAALLGNQALLIRGFTEETYWLCGEAVPAPATEARANWPSTILRDTGYCVSRTSSADHLLFDVGPHGFKNAGHAHADALSVNLTVAGTPLLIDPGTGTYTMDPAMRDRFRSTVMHNTITLNGRPQSIPRGPFHWASSANSRANVTVIGNGCDYFEGSHDGYRPLEHTRGVLAIHGLGWFIIDVIGGDASVVADTHWHLHPAWVPTARTPFAISAQYDGHHVAILASTALEVIGPNDESGIADVSLAYGRVERSHTLRSSLRGRGPHVLLTCIDPSPHASSAGSVTREAVTRRREDEPASVAFRIDVGAAQVRLLATVGRDRPINASRSHWGCADLVTDARLACVIEYRDGRSEAVLLYGSRIESASGDRLFELPATAQLIRMSRADRLAHLMH